MRLVVDESGPNKCIWCGVCEHIAPNVFHVEKNKYSLTGAIYVNQSEVTVNRDRTVLCIEACPMNSIRLVNEEKPSDALTSEGEE